MNNGQRTVAGLLAVVAVLLGLNLIVGGLRPAAAQEPEFRIFPPPPLPPPPKVVHGTVRDVGGSCGVSNFTEKNYTRFWDDGTIDITTLCVSSRDCLPLADPAQSCGPTVIVSGF